MSLMPEYPRNAFKGTASDYARYRPPYPPELFAHLRARFGEMESKTLLDLACGPGRVTFALAPYFAKVVAIDREAEMIAEATSEASRRRADNISWRISDAEPLEFHESSLGAVTVGDAMHRLDTDKVLRKVLVWLEPGGVFANLGSHPHDARSDWQRARDAVVLKYRRALVPGEIPVTDGIVARDIAQGEKQLSALGFTAVASFTFSVPHTWTLESLLGNLHSTSFCSRAVLGARAQAFAHELREALAPFGPELSDELTYGYTMGR